MSSTVTDETIMPDGRPFFAWKKELELARRDRADVDRHRKNLQGWGNVRRILEAQQWQEWPGGDLLIRIKRNTLTGCANLGEIPPDQADVYEIPLDTAAKRIRF